MNQLTASNLELHRSTSLPFLRNSRDLVVYTPPGYRHTDARYPVLYMHDGQNLFDPATAFAGNDWRLGELLDRLIEEKKIPPLIVVGIFNAGAKRIAEYTPVKNGRGVGGGAARYGRMLVNEIKPFIDRTYRTYSDRESTALGGSSLGGLVTLYFGLKFPKVFSKLIVMSPSLWWGGRWMLSSVRKLRRKLQLKIWLDTGTCEGTDPAACVADASALRDLLIEKGWSLSNDFAYLEDEGAGHDEHSWGRRMRDALMFLFAA